MSCRLGPVLLTILFVGMGSGCGGGRGSNGAAGGPVTCHATCNDLGWKVTTGSGASSEHSCSRPIQTGPVTSTSCQTTSIDLDDSQVTCNANSCSGSIVDAKTGRSYALIAALDWGSCRISLSIEGLGTCDVSGTPPADAGGSDASTDGGGTSEQCAVLLRCTRDTNAVCVGGPVACSGETKPVGDITTSTRLCSYGATTCSLHSCVIGGVASGKVVCSGAESCSTEWGNGALACDLAVGAAGDGGTNTTDGGSGGGSGAVDASGDTDGATGTTSTCADLLACCNAASGTFKTDCLQFHAALQPMGDTGCGQIFDSLKTTFCP